MGDVKRYSLLLGGLSRAADMPGLERQIVPSPSDVEVAAQAVLHAPITVTGGQRDPSVSLGLGSDPNQSWSAPRRYLIEAPSELSPSELYAGLVLAMLDVAPLPSGIVSNWTVRVALENDSGEWIADRTFEIPRGGGRRRFLSPSGIGGIALGALVGAWLGGPVGLAIGAPLGAAGGEALERLFPSTPAPKPRQV